MSFPSITLLLCLWLSPAIAYKLLLLDKALLTNDDTIDKPNNSPSGNNYKWKWQSQDRMDEGNLILARLRREIIDKKSKKGDVKPDATFIPKVNPTEPPLDEISNTSPYILVESTAALEVHSNPLLIEDETTTLIHLEETTKGTGQKLDDDETTHIGKSITQSSDLVTELTVGPTTSEELSVLTSNKYNKATKANQVHSTHSQDASSQHTSTNNLLEDVTSSFSSKAPETSPTSTPVILHDLTTRHDVTTVLFSAFSGSSTKLAAVTHLTTSLEDKAYTQSIMRQCMLTILILAVVCTIFIISTVALAAKLSTMKQKSKLRHPVTYTEMRCISSLLPDNDQQNKPKPKTLKTFGASLEESDGDNTTLNSFLPDH